MKRILLACGFIAISSVSTFAQDAAPAPNNAQSQIALKDYFGAKLNELSAYLLRKNPDLAEAAYGDLAGMMQKGISETKDKLAKASEDQKDGIRKTLSAQDKLYGEVKELAGDMNKNERALLDKLRAFRSTL